MLSVRQIVNKPIMEAVRQGKIGKFAQKAMMSYFDKQCMPFLLQK